ncbi:MAG: hypothetical protein KatS3mg116_2079 [Elioraea sp.]|nr:MAG: hypothetical protein KatS3mg116_2079 [Elioraea sp.]
MTDAFALAAEALVSDPHMGVDADWRAGGMAPPVAVRVVRASPDRVAGAFDTAIVQATDVLTIATAHLPAVTPGDTFTIVADVLTVQHVERSASGAFVSAFCRRG